MWLTVVLAILKIIWFPAACIVALIAGLMIGYVMLGGQPSSEVFHIQTWKHLFDLVFAAS
ncbi:hypothetical protein SD70_11965 [Gordoniibacillus kamchatkensis]|uniref:DNA-directed RNA polymerase subunit beta n=1 Tax=Gordoniibacillus kamchatkensis TaxID=1590651 RepID=A0ABR5AI45_9BACL|nr:hypothetical protein SD70_11965 [Paenibacillus sp. VKM B-2647]